MAMSNISINDGKTTPLAHVFVPHSAQVGNTAAVWYNKVTGFSTRAWEKLTTLVAMAPNAKSEHRLALSIDLPKVALVDGIEVPQGSVRGYFTVIAPYGLNTDDNLKDVFALLKAAAANAEATKVFTTMSPST